MATPVEPPNGEKPRGKHYYSIWQILFEIDTKYVPIKPIGRGSYGVVCSSINRETNEKVAIKKISNVFGNRIDALRTLRELKLLRHIRHENVIDLKDIMMPASRTSFKDVYLVYELMDTDLLQIIKSPQPLTNDHCKYFVFQLLRGLKYLHSASILHRDLKPGNLLINANCDLKICDFGLARTSIGNEQFMTEYVVTRWYRSPELLLCCDNYGTSIDVWSVGCIFAEILGRQPIFPGTECLNQLKLIFDVLGSQEEADLEFIDNPKARRYIKSLPYTRGIHFSQALQHPYMSSLYDPSRNPPARVPINLDIDEKNMGEQMIREMMLSEMLHYHPEAASTNDIVIGNSPLDLTNFAMILSKQLVEAENSVLRAQMSELTTRLQSLNEIIDFINSSNGVLESENFYQAAYFNPHHQINDDAFMYPWNSFSVNQPFMASADMIMY
ncbi:Mitogen-activated protein kinase 7 [Hibiscus syriacus]|uniref:Mitogen-activated protein kinase n=1 Tax=Hibiscus syriacus TaxID=106335 RepID=A0A6A2Y5R4_HIBSY|nr:Mitogen-activated protein kinase 7 [Hibiscus syriacus]